jgi:molecular chaperone DnaK
MIGIPPAPAGVPKIQVTFDISANGTIHVTSMDEASKVKQDVVINMAGGLSAADIERMRKEAEVNKAQDQDRQETVK